MMPMRIVCRPVGSRRVLFIEFLSGFDPIRIHCDDKKRSNSKQNLAAGIEESGKEIWNVISKKIEIMFVLQEKS